MDVTFLYREPIRTTFTEHSVFPSLLTFITHDCQLCVGHTKVPHSKIFYLK